MSVPARSEWGPGPWDAELDRYEWRSPEGLVCLIVRTPMGHLCGYVGVPPGHPYHGVGYDDLDIEVHGGLTYAGACKGKICHVPRDGEPEVWWLGFDCAHCFDLSPGLVASVELAWEADGCEYRDKAYVEAEVNRLAAQLENVPR